MANNWTIITDPDVVDFTNTEYFDGDAKIEFPIYTKVLTGGHPVVIMRAFVYWSGKVWKAMLSFGEYATYYRADTPAECQAWVDNIITGIVSYMYTAEI